jgi:transposase-like protein
MLKLSQKLDILRGYFNEGKKIKQLKREVGISRNTIRNYIRDFEEKRNELTSQSATIEEIIELMVEKPKYNASSRVSTVMTDEIKEKINCFLEENQRKVLIGMRKQCMTGKDIHEQLLEFGFNLSYPSVIQYISKVHIKSKEAFIKQVYNYGEVCEFDWGECKLYIEGEKITYKLAIFTLAKSNLRYAMLYRNEDTQAFIDAHVKFFKFIGGVPKSMVYDNMRVAVAKFVGNTEKEATESLKKLSLYYGFNYRFCNVARGNEKGHVENAVDFTRRKAFAYKYSFESFDEATKYLSERLIWINNNSSKEKCSANEVFKEERKYLLQLQPDYDVAIVTELRIDKLSTIMFKGNRYSVPDYLVGKYVTVKIYLEKIKIYHNLKLIAEHMRSFGRQTWTLSIEHYRKTLLRKPGALKNSLVMNQLNIRIKVIFEKFFFDNPREFLNLLDVVSEHGIEKVEKTIKKLSNTNIAINLDNIKLIINKNVTTDNYTNIYGIDSIEKLAQNQLNKYDELANTYDTELEVII